MEKKEIWEKVLLIGEDIGRRIKGALKEQLEGVTFLGSYVTGKIVFDRPDIDLMIFFKERAQPEHYWKLGEIWSSIEKTYQDSFNIRMEFRPFRFIYPRIYDKGKLDFFINPIFANMSERDLEFPFGIPKYVLSGFRETRKVYFGTDVLGNMDLSFTPAEMREGVMRDLAMFALQLSRAPTQYDLDTEYHLLYNEAMCFARFAVYCGVEVAMTDEEISKAKYMEYIINKGKMYSFYQDRYENEVAEMANFILDSRINYATWRFDKQKAWQLYRYAFKMSEAVMRKIL